MVIEVYLLWIADIKGRKAWIVTPALDSHISTYYCSVLSCVLLFATPWTVALFSIFSQSLLWEFAQTHVYWVSDVMQPFHSLLPSSPPAINLSQHQVFFPMNWLFESGGQSVWALALALVLPMNIQGWFSLWITGLIFLQSKGLSRVFSSTTIWKNQFIGTQTSLWSNSQHPYMTTGKTIALTIWTFVGKVMSLHLNTLPRFVTDSFPRSKHLLISWLQSPSAVILEPKRRKSVTASTFFPSICHNMMELDTMILVFWMLSFKPAFSLSSFILIKRLCSSFILSAIRMVSSAYPRLLIFLLAILILACASSSPAFYMMYSAYKLNTQGDNIQPCYTPFPILN